MTEAGITAARNIQRAINEATGRLTTAGHRVTMRVNTTDRCIDVRCLACDFRTSAQTIDQATRAMTTHVCMTEARAWCPCQGELAQHDACRERANR